MRERVGDDYVVGVRFLGDEVIAGGNRIADAVYFGVEFAKAGFDYLSDLKRRQVRGRRATESRARRFILTPARAVTNACPRRCLMKSGPFGRSVPLVAKIKHAVNTAGFNDADGRHRRNHNL